MSGKCLSRRMLTALVAVWLLAAAAPSTALGNDPVRIGLLNVDGHAWWFGGFFNPYDEARLEKNFPRAAERNRLIASLLFNVKPGDPLTFLAVAALLAVVAVAASALPAHRAVRITPIAALRCE